MARFFIPRQWRLPKVVYFFLILELPFTVANLALFGIASPNLYRTILWKEGGDRGFNSDPTTILYAAANYRPVNIPLVWSSLNTNYNLYIGVICMFFYLIKCTGWLLHVFYPVFSLPLHIGLMALWAVSIHMQTSPDTIDPERQNNGAPWYITKNCNIVEDKNIRGYCMQAKAAFAISVCMLAIYIIHILFAAYSLYPTKAARDLHATKLAEKKAQKEKWAAASPYEDEMTAEQQWQHMWELQQLPRTPGTTQGMWNKTPMTPRSTALSGLEGAPQQQGAYAQAGYAQQEVYPQDYPQEKYAQFGEGEVLQQGPYAPYDGKGKGTAM